MSFNGHAASSDIFMSALSSGAASPPPPIGGKNPIDFRHGRLVSIQASHVDTSRPQESWTELLILTTAAHSAQQVWSIGHFLFSATEELSVDALAPIISAS